MYDVHNVISMSSTDSNKFLLCHKITKVLLITYGNILYIIRWAKITSKLPGTFCKTFFFAKLMFHGWHKHIMLM